MTKLILGAHYPPDITPNAPGQFPSSTSVPTSAVGFYVDLQLQRSSILPARVLKAAPRLPDADVIQSHSATFPPSSIMQHFHRGSHTGRSAALVILNASFLMQTSEQKAQFKA